MAFRSRAVAPASLLACLLLLSGCAAAGQPAPAGGSDGGGGGGSGADAASGWSGEALCAAAAAVDPATLIGHEPQFRPLDYGPGMAGCMINTPDSVAYVNVNLIWDDAENADATYAVDADKLGAVEVAGLGDAARFAGEPGAIAASVEMRVGDDYASLQVVAHDASLVTQDRMLELFTGFADELGLPR